MIFNTMLEDLASFSLSYLTQGPEPLNYTAQVKAVPSRILLLCGTWDKHTHVCVCTYIYNFTHIATIQIYICVS